MNPKILFLDDSEDMRELMGMLAKSKLGEDCLTLDSVDSLMSHETEALESSLAILDVNLGAGKPSGLDAFNWLKDRQFKGKIFFLTGHARSHPLIIKACETGAGVWAKPIASDFIISSIKNILKEREQPA
jgi:FixJ family two-component response regulator